MNNETLYDAVDEMTGGRIDALERWTERVCYVAASLIVSRGELWITSLALLIYILHFMLMIASWFVIAAVAIRWRSK